MRKASNHYFLQEKATESIQSNHRGEDNGLELLDAGLYHTSNFSPGLGIDP